MLMIRRSSELFRLRTSGDVMQAVHFEDAGVERAPGLIVMRLQRPDGRAVAIVINATTEQQTVSAPGGQRYRLHDVQRRSTDMTVRRSAARNGQLTVPALTVAIFVQSD
jgi:pullulanase